MMIIDSRLLESSSLVTNLTLCQVRLSHNAAFPWIILIPQIEGIRELIDLSYTQQHQLMDEISVASQIMKDLFSPTKLNVASLGNVVPQLHVHIIARYETDKAWPGPVWNSGIHFDYKDHDKNGRLSQLKTSFKESVFSLIDIQSSI